LRRKEIIIDTAKGREEKKAPRNSDIARHRNLAILLYW
jgi:hypothetical protein